MGMGRPATQRRGSKKREEELAEPGAIEALKAGDPLLSEVIGQYITESQKAIGKTKSQVLETKMTQAVSSRNSMRRLAGLRFEPLSREQQDSTHHARAWGQGAVRRPRIDLEAGRADQCRKAITGETPERVAQREDALYAEIADLLTRPAGQVMPAVNQLGRRDMATELMRNRINRTFNAATIPTTSQTGTQVRERLQPWR